MDPQTGRVLAVASYPDYNPQLFVGGISNKNYTGAHRAERGRSAAEPRDRRAVRTGLDVQADHHVVAGDPSRDLADRHVPVSRVGDDRRPGQDELRQRVVRRTDLAARTRSATRATRSSTCRRRTSTTPTRPASPTARSRTSACSTRRPQFGVGRAPGHRPAGERAGHRLVRRPRDATGALEGEQGSRTAPTARKGYPNVTEPDRSCLPDPARVGELHRRLALPRRRQRRHGDRAGRDDDVAAATGGRVLGAGERRADLAARSSAGAIVNAQGQAGQDDQAQGARHGAGAAEHARLHRQLAQLRPRLGGVGRVRVPALAVPRADRRQDRNGRGVRQEDTSWLATWGPIYHTKKGHHVRARFVLVGMVEQAGTGATAAGPMLKRIWDGMFGAGGKADHQGDRARRPRFRSAAR